MTGTIVERLITTRPKAGFYAMMDTSKRRIQKVEGREVIFADGSTAPIEEVRNRIIRYVAKVQPDGEFHVLYSDYGKVNDSMVFDGYTVERKCNSYENDMIRITDIDIIDKHGMHDIRKRQGVVLRLMPGNRFNPTYEIQLQYERNVLMLKRDQFILTEKTDKRLYFHPRCDECKQ